MGMLEKFRLDGKVAVVTGGGRGIGEGIALAFADCGADVMVLARRQNDVDRVAGEIRKRGRRAAAISGDVMDRATIPVALDRVVNEFGRLDIMVNCAGGNLDHRTHALPEITYEKWEEQVAFNLTTKFWGAQQAAKRMQDGGRIINIVSVSAHHAHAGFGAYSAANSGVIAMTRTMALELAPRRITVNSIAPGAIVTELMVLTLHMSEEECEKMAKEVSPLGRSGRGEDIGAAALLFASPAGDWITGQCLDVDGGLMLR